MFLKLAYLLREHQIWTSGPLTADSSSTETLHCLNSVSKMAIFATFQILCILRVLTECFFELLFLIEQFSVIIVFLSLLSKFSFSNSVQILFYQKVCMKKLRVFCVNMH